MYSRIMETYLTVCVPQLGVTVRQFGWSGERAPGFLARMENDVLRFEPTIATTCYGMNDHGYQPYQDELGNTYREASRAIVRLFKEHGVRVIQGSPGTVGKMPVLGQAGPGHGRGPQPQPGGVPQHRPVASRARSRSAFADVFCPMLVGGFEGKKRFGTTT